MSLPESLALGILSALPVGALLFLRWRKLSPAMDERAAAAFAKRASLFASATALASALMFFLGGDLPAPALWQLAPAAAAAALFLYAVGGSRR